MNTRAGAWRILIIAGCCIAALAIAGASAESKVHQTSLSVSGTESANTEALVRHYFGDSETFIVLLKGPTWDVRSQGRRLVRILERDPLTTTISPWSPGAIRQLKPTHRSALIFVSFSVGLDEAVKRTVPHLNELLARQIHQPVQVVQSGYPSISRAIQDEAAQATRQGELIAIPLVLVVLMLVFQSPVAASIPLAFGAATVAGSHGILAIIANWLSIDAFALTVSTMMGLALGIDYTLLMVSRFREELAAGNPPIAAARATRRTAGKTVAFAGGALFVSMIASALILPGTFLVSLAGAVVTVAGFSVVLGVLVVPALLLLIGERINRWSLGFGRKNAGPMLGAIDRVLRRPGLAVVLLTVPLIVLALPAMSLAVGPPSLDQLPSTNRARLNAELVNREVGPGWAGPYVVLVASNDGPITSQRKLAVMRRWERSIARVGSVEAVIGPGAIANRVAPLREFGSGLFDQHTPGSQTARLRRLASHLGRAAKGVESLRSGLARTTYGAGLLSTGSQGVERGTQVLAGGLAEASGGTDKSAAALGRFASGAGEIRAGQHRAALGSLALKFDIQDLIPRLRHSTLSPAQKLLQELTNLQGALPSMGDRAEEADHQLGVALLEFERMSEVPNDPHFGAALDAVRAAQGAIDGSAPGMSGGQGITNAGLSAELHGFDGAVLDARKRATLIISGVGGGLEDLHEAAPLAVRLTNGLRRLEAGGRLLEAGARRLAWSTSVLAAGMPRLSRGAATLSGGAERLAGGTLALASGLSRAYTQSHPLETGLHDAASQATDGERSLQRQVGRLRRVSPELFNSGYFNLSALDGTPPKTRSSLQQLVDITQGGQAARILVIPKYEGAVGLDKRLRALAPRLGQRLGGTAGVAGGRAELHDYARASSSRLPIVIAVVSLVTFLSLVLILRAVLVPALTVVLNLVSVAVAFGVLALLSNLPSQAPIGGWSHIDTIGAVAIFAIAFGVSIDYSVFILMRIREEFDRGVAHDAAVGIGVQRTGRIITGAALMMVAVFAAFATSSLAIVSQLGAGLTMAILVDATVIRLVLLPALLLLLGERCWWLPPPLRQRLAGLHTT
jgi:putative drug exporter of the RND superfamily